ncbi:binding-protein-dependent transport systems inner membrane component [Cyanobacterium stanieri PCC 7202]|uniref:Binding-protein-dependent transport systems inner membrane component n=1 Tax=Cyanobacterium stanieri (strain ATCC 29140 / PCC 7202) TaxID=292563 RepID=K9YKE5_CYASC|nr:binding-protein-dependent transport systems inner membrane component [Cyanobacterium stanieri PCC 7202]
MLRREIKVDNFILFSKVWHRLPTFFWYVTLIGVAVLISIPILTVAFSIFGDNREIWQHLVNTVLSSYIINSLVLMGGVATGVLVIGVGCAWLVTMTEFWGVRWLECLLLMPLAAPAYLLAYAYTYLLSFFGPIQIWLRNIFGWQTFNDYWFPELRGMPGAIAMLVLVLYPYVYLLARVAFLEQSICTIEASRSLGNSPWQSFFKVGLPLARPAIMAGLALALMEALNDFGTVQYFGVNTFTTGIYRTWIGMGERQAAAQLSLLLMGFIVFLILLERWSRAKAKFYQGNANDKLPRYQLGLGRGILAFLCCALPLTLGFIVPTVYLFHLTISNIDATLNDQFWTLTQNSFILAVVSALIAVAIALTMAYGERLIPTIPIKTAIRISALGYAIPGAVIAVGILIPLGAFDNIMIDRFNISTGLIFSGTVTALIYGYVVRFLAVSFHTVESSLGKIKPHLDDASRSLGLGTVQTLFKVHLPLMWGGIFTAIMLVFVDVMKELPATLVMRPFNFDTLAIRVYQYASDERLIEASAPSLAIILAGIVPVIILSYGIATSRQR